MQNANRVKKIYRTVTGVSTFLEKQRRISEMTSRKPDHDGCYDFT